VTIIDEQSFGKSWHDGYSPIIFIRLHNAIASKNNIPLFFKKVFDARHQLLKKFEGIFVIVDLAPSTQHELETLLSSTSAQFNRLLDREIRLFCVVSAKNLNADLLGSQNKRVMHFKNYYHALDKVNKLRLESVSYE
jgi:hypothetical protein